jgi:hypothetical protein
VSHEIHLSQLESKLEAVMLETTLDDIAKLDELKLEA